MSENTLDPMLDVLGSGNPPSASPTRTSPRKRKADPKPAPAPIPKKNWLIEEDKALCTAWLETTRDPIIGNGQKSESISTTQIFVECRWGHILKFVNKFIGFYSQSERGEGDVQESMQDALQLGPLLCVTEGHSKISDGLRQTPNTPSTSANRASSPVTIDIENEETSELSALGNERMEGQKAAKKKRADDQSIGKIVHMQKELVQISREQLETMKSALQDASDEAILSKDLDSMSGQKRRYYERKLQLIFDQEDALEKKQKEEEEKKKIEIKKAKDNNLEDEAGIEFE
ncbi:hypothetical protein PSTG_12446 [Puccinia striiformis f. sp. tritici PST-78]|uniref:No apical meristem-associated C-terminal domain-containing protein n=1 Tax=Puccinia striiformis f. sp. tritici PST-78 TaxID=1165861 RepID=A0A0L0V4J5_9BASI|nr:hypothetical protein PSTG_12446 [Puccinia striiformis f. sp. tritici PST-78]